MQPALLGADHGDVGAPQPVWGWAGELAPDPVTDLGAALGRHRAGPFGAAQAGHDGVLAHQPRHPVATNLDMAGSELAVHPRGAVAGEPGVDLADLDQHGSVLGGPLARWAGQPGPPGVVAGS
jgi:hypothetical protein